MSVIRVLAWHIFGVRGLPAGEGQKLFGQIGPSVYRLHCPIEQHPYFVFQTAPIRRQFKEAGNHGQEVVEVMGPPRPSVGLPLPSYGIGGVAR